MGHFEQKIAFVVALDPQSIVGIIFGCVTVVGGVGSYVISVEKRLNGRKALQDTLDRIERKVDSTDTRVRTVEITVTRLEQKMKDAE